MVYAVGARHGLRGCCAARMGHRDEARAALLAYFSLALRVEPRRADMLLAASKSS